MFVSGALLTLYPLGQEWLISKLRDESWIVIRKISLFNVLLSDHATVHRVVSVESVTMFHALLGVVSVLVSHILQKILMKSEFRHTSRYSVSLGWWL